MTLVSFHLKTLQVRITLIVGIKDDSRPRLVSIKFLYTQNVVFIMIGRVKVRDIELSVLKNDQDTILIRELSEVTTMVFVVDTVDIWVEPNLTTT